MINVLLSRLLHKIDLSKHGLSLLILCFYSFSQTLSQTNPGDLGINENIMGLTSKPTSQFGQPALGSSDLYTGVATYSIPLFELKSYQLAVRVSLNYASGGVRVDDIGGWLGISWHLNAGGEINREMRGYPDELPGKGYFIHGDKPKDFVNKTTDEKIDIINKSQEKGYDFQPDIFHYNFGGESGYFVFDNNQQIHLVPYRNWRVQKTISNNRITEFSITTDNGITFKFGGTINSMEETKISTLKSAAHWNFMQTVTFLLIDYGSIEEENEIGDFYTSKWYLTEISSISKDKILFEYDDAGILTYVEAPKTMASETMTGLQVDLVKDPYFGEAPAIKPHLMAYSKLTFIREGSLEPCNDPVLPGSYPDCLDDPNIPKPCIDSRDQAKVIVPLKYFFHQNRFEVKSKILKKIISLNNSYIDFAHDPASTVPGNCKINRISLYDLNNHLVKSYNLTFSKITSNSADPSGQYLDPFSPMEFIAFKDANIPKTGSYFVPANKAQNYQNSILLYERDLLIKYVYEGLKPYNYERYFLEKVEEEGLNMKRPAYTFTYNEPEKIIRRTSVWTSKLNYSQTQPLDQIIFKLVESNSYQVSDGLFKEPVTAIGTSYGQLNKITLPSGGYVQYYYEPTRNDNNPVILFGVKRVSKIIQNDGIRSSAKKITYQTISHKALTSYSRDIPFYDLPNSTVYRMVLTTSFNLEELHLTKGSPIGYKLVKVENCAFNDCSTTNGYEEFEFIGFNPEDILDLVSENNFGKTYEYPKSFELKSKCQWFKPDRDPGEPYAHYVIEHSAIYEKSFKSYDYNYFSSRDHARGSLKRHTVYDGTNRVKEILYKYTMKEFSNVVGLNGRTYNFMFEKLVGDDNCILGDCINDWDPYLLPKHIANLSIHFSSALLLHSKIEKVYDIKYPNDVDKTISIVKENSQFDPVSLKVREESSYVLNSANQVVGDILKTKFRYPSEFTDNLVIKSMNYYKMNLPIETMNFRNDLIIDASLTSFLCKDCDQIITGLPPTIVLRGPILPAESFMLETSGPIEKLSFQETTSSLNRDPRLKSKMFYDYDSKGNIIQVNPTDGKFTSYLWAYNKTLPIAKIENANYANVISALTSIGSSETDIETKSMGENDESQLVQLFNNLRNTTAMQDALITSYTYDPLIGMRSETDASGKTTFYEYDGLGRLSLVKNDRQQILKTYEYNYTSLLVKFDSQGGSAVGDIKAENNKTIERPADPTKTGHSFGGWYKEPSCTTPWNFSTDIVSISTVLYARWIPNIYTVQFDPRNGENPTSVEVAYNQPVYAIAEPSMTGWTFTFWSSDPAGNQTWNFSTDLVTSDMTLYAQYQVNSYTINFDTRGGSPVSSQEVNYGSLVSRPADPSKTSYVFGGWYKALDYVNEWYFGSQVVTGPTTIYAKWNPLTYTIAASKTGSGTMNPVGNSTVNYGGSVTYSFSPATGYYVKNVKVDGVNLGTRSSYTFSNVTANHTISVEFAVVLSVDRTQMYFDESGGTETFTITSGVSWTITKSLWLSLSQSSGSGNSTITVTCSPIIKGARTGSITITGGGVTRTISVSQSLLPE